jgi:hypothetical protein
MIAEPAANLFALDGASHRDLHVAATGFDHHYIYQLVAVDLPLERE